MKEVSARIQDLPKSAHSFTIVTELPLLIGMSLFHASSFILADPLFLSCQLKECDQTGILAVNPGAVISRLLRTLCTCLEYRFTQVDSLPATNCEALPEHGGWIPNIAPLSQSDPAATSVLDLTTHSQVNCLVLVPLRKTWLETTTLLWWATMTIRCLRWSSCHRTKHMILRYMSKYQYAWSMLIQVLFVLSKTSNAGKRCMFCLPGVFHAERRPSPLEPVHRTCCPGSGRWTDVGHEQHVPEDSGQVQRVVCVGLCYGRTYPWKHAAWSLAFLLMHFKVY